MMERRAHLDGVAIAVMLVCCVLWGLQQVVVKLTLPALPPFLQGATRSAIAATLVCLWSASRGIPLFRRDATLVPGIVAGLLFGIEFLCIYAALPLTDASRVSVFIYLAPFVVAVLLPRFVPAERLSPLQIAGLTCAFAALAFAFQEGFTSGAVARGTQWIGDSLAIAAAVAWGATTLVIRTTCLATTSPEKTLLYQLTISAVVIYGASLWVGEQWARGGHPALGLGFAAVPVRGGRVRELSGVVLAAAPLPRDATVGVLVPHAAVRSRVRVARARRTHRGAPDGRAGLRRDRHHAREPQAGRRRERGAMTCVDARKPA